MEYSKGSIKRVFLVRFDNNDILIEKVRELAQKERIACGFLLFLGALRKGHVVTGPKRPKIPPKPHWEGFNNAWEVMGMGTIIKGKKAPQVHIHGALGKGKKSLIGCIRKDSEIFLLVEALIIELSGIKAKKDLDPQTGLNLLRFI